MNRLRVGVIGAGYWGPNLVRNFASCPQTEICGVCDADPVRLQSVARRYSGLNAVTSIEELLDLSLDAVAIATPVSTHFSIAKECLEAGVHVLIEKPLAASAAEALALIELATHQGRVLMVDHTYLFSNAVRHIEKVVASGELGELYYVDGIRINLGLFQHDINVVWDLAPHDLSIMDYVIKKSPRSISSWGCSHTIDNHEDIAYVNLDYSDQFIANLHVNWLSPVKVRQIIFAGTRRSLIFNELNSTEPIKIYDRGIEIGHGLDDRQKVMVNYRSGAISSPHIDQGEPLQAVVSHFADCIRESRIPISDGQLGLRVVRLIEAANRSLKARGGRVACSTANPQPLVNPMKSVLSDDMTAPGPYRSTLMKQKTSAIQ